MKQIQPTFDVKAFLQLLLRHWYVIVIAAIIGAAIGFCMFKPTESTEVSATIKLNAPDDIVGLPTGRIDRNRFRDNENAIIASHDLHIRCMRNMLDDGTYPFAMPPKTEEAIVQLANHLDRDYQFETSKDYAATITIKTNTKSPKEEMVIMDYLVQTYIDTTVNRAKEMLLQNNQMLDSQITCVNQMRDKILRDSLINDILHKKEYNMVLLSNAGNTISYISHPHITSHTTSSHHKHILLLTAIFICLAGGIYLLYVLFSNCVMSVEQVEDFMDKPVLSVVPKQLSCKYLRKYCSCALSQTAAARFLCEAWLAKYPEGKVLMVTSYKAREGKTFIAKHVAMSLAETGKRVAFLNLNPTKQPLSLSNVDVITLQPNPTTHLRMSDIQTSLAELRGKYDYVIVDTKALRDDADILLLKESIDVTMLIIRPWRTTFNNIIEMQRMPFRNTEYVINAI